MPWAGPWWRTVTAQVTGRYVGEAQRRRRTRRAAGGGAGARPQERNVQHHRPQACWPLACCAGRRQCMGGARMERVRPCATHVHRSKLLFEMELDEIRYPPVHLHEHAMCADHGRPMHGRVMSLYSKWVALSRTVYSSGTRDRAAAFSVTTCEDT